jgi:co-chaperonin GroES (HSP10)
MIFQTWINMTPTNNYILVEVTPRDKVGNIVIPDKADDMRMFTETSGIVREVPDQLKYKQGHAKTVHVNVGMELKENDTVYFHFLCIREAKGEGRFWEENGKMFLLVHYNDCFAAKRGEDITPLNGFILAEPVDTSMKSKIILLDAKGEGRDALNRCVVRYTGKVIQEYKFGVDDTVIQPDCYSINSGDEIILLEGRGGLLQPYGADIEGDKKFYYFQRRDILCKFVNDELVSISDRIIVKTDPRQEKIGSIYIPESIDTRGNRGHWGEVISVGPKCRDTNMGERVYFNYYQAKKILVGTYPNQTEYSSIREREIEHKATSVQQV